MRRLVVVLCLSIILLPSSRVPGFCAYEDMGLFARDLSLAGAFTAAADDASAVAYNPAGLAALRSPEIALGHSRFFVIPACRLKVEGMAGAALAPIEVFGSPGTLGLAGRTASLDRFSHDRELELSYARRGARGEGEARLDFGFTMRVQQRSAIKTSAQRNSLGADAGLLYRSGIHALGFSALNIGAPDMSLAGVRDRASSSFKAGYGLKTQALLFTLDLTHRLSAAGHPAGYTAASGAERLWGFRTGALATRAGLGLGNREKTAGVGIGWRTQGLRVDYAAVFSFRRLPAGHVFTLGFRYGGGNPSQEYEKLLSQEIENQRQLMVLVNRLETEIAGLKGDLEKARTELESAKSLSETSVREAATASEALGQLKARQEEAEARLAQAREEQSRLRRQETASSFKGDWDSYQKLKASGAPRSVLREKLERLLQLHKDKGMDLGEVHQEMLRLLKGSQ